MNLKYICRYCRTLIGSIVNHDLTEEQLGFDQLTPEERKDIIIDNMDGNQEVQVVCETCQQILSEKPELHLLPRLYH